MPASGDKASGKTAKAAPVDKAVAKKAAPAKHAAAHAPEKAAPPEKAAKKAVHAPDKHAPAPSSAAKAVADATADASHAEPDGPAKAAPAHRSPGRLPHAAAKHAPEPEPEPVEETYADDAEFLAAQRQLLIAERETYSEQARILRAEAESLVAEAEPGDVQFDEESGEGGTTTVDRERDLALSAQALAAVEEIDHALEKIDNGRYGICESCAQLIAKPRLEALPYVRLCIACKNGGLSRR